MKAHCLILLSALVGGCAGAKIERGPAALVEAERSVPVHTLAVESEMVTVVVGVRAGSAHDPPGQEGLSWLTAQQLLRGGSLHEQVSGWGGRITAEVSDEIVAYTLQMPPDKAEEAVQALGTALAQPTFSAETLEASREEGVRWLREGLASSDARLVQAAFESWVFQGHPYGHVSEGRASVLSTLSIEDVKRFYDHRYIRSSLAVAHSQNLGASAAEGLQAALSQRPAQLYSDVTPRPVSPVRDVQVLAVLKAGATPSVYLGHPLNMSVGDEGWAALLLARAAAGPDVDLDALLGEATLQPHLSLWFSADEGQSPQVLVDAALAGVSAWVSQGIAQADFDSAQASLTAKIEAAEKNHEALLQQRVETALLNRPQTLASLKTAIASLSLADVNSTLAKQIDPGALRVVVLADEWQVSDGSNKTIGAIHIVKADGLFR